MTEPNPHRVEPSGPDGMLVLTDVVHSLTAYDSVVGHDRPSKALLAMQRGREPSHWTYLGVWHGVTRCMRHVVVYAPELDIKERTYTAGRRSTLAQSRDLPNSDTPVPTVYADVLRDREKVGSSAVVYPQVWLPTVARTSPVVVVHAPATWRRVAWRFDRRAADLTLLGVLRRWEALRSLVTVVCVDFAEHDLLWPVMRRQTRLLIVGNGADGVPVVAPFMAVDTQGQRSSDAVESAMRTLRSVLEVVNGTIDFDKCLKVPGLADVWRGALEPFQLALAHEGISIDRALAAKLCTAAGLRASLEATMSVAKPPASPSGPALSHPSKRSRGCGARPATATQPSLSLWFQPVRTPAFSARSLLAPPSPSTSTPSTKTSLVASPSTASSGRASRPSRKQSTATAALTTMTSPSGGPSSSTAKRPASPSPLPTRTMPE